MKIPLFVLCGIALLAASIHAESFLTGPWKEYRTIMWIGDSAEKKPEKLPLFYQRLREMGINTGMVSHLGDAKPLVAAGFPYYVENIVNRGLCLKFNSKVRDWGQHVTEWAKTRDEAGLIRDYSLDDPKWLAEAVKDVQEVVRKNRALQPLAYDLRDELSTTSSANPFDYDFSPLALEGFRNWLRETYHDLAALNLEWATEFKTWGEVKPFTTDQIKNRMASGDNIPRGKPDWQTLQKLTFDPVTAAKESSRWNFAPWADHRTYMDVSLARALGSLGHAAGEIDRKALVGIEGTQMPSAFGGYDLARLSQVLDWVEPYDIGNSREILGSFMPGKPILTTVGEQDSKAAQRRLWHLLLEGDSGCIVWWSEDCIDWKSDDYALTPRGMALAPVLKELNSPVGRLFLRAEREFDPIYLHYSQPSIQVDWLLGSTEDGSTWLRRFSSYEASHNRLVKVRNAWLKSFTDLGYSPRFITSDQIEGGGLESAIVLAMPSSVALSDVEGKVIQQWVKGGSTGRVLLTDGTPGVFDDHGKLRASPALGAMFPAANSAQKSFSCISKSNAAESKSGDIATYNEARVAAKPGLDWPRWIAAQLGDMRPPVSVPLESRTAIFRYRLGKARLLAFERNVSCQMSEDLKQAGGNGSLETPVEVRATLAEAGHLYDLRTQEYLGFADHLDFTLDPWHPALFAILPEEIPAARLIETLAKAAR